MATMLFDRIVPSGNNAYFPFQMSAASLNPNATVFEADDASGADTALTSGVSVDDMGGGLYALKVLAANMTADKLYYAVVTSGNESVRIPMWAFAPSKHVAEALDELAALKTELGDVSGESYTGISSPASVAAALATIFNKVNGVQADLDNATDGLGALKTIIETETTAIDSALTTIDNEIAALQGDVTSILADTAELQGDWANGGRLDALLDRTVAASEASEDLIGLATDTSADATVFGKISKLAGDVATVDTVVDGIASALAHGTTGLAALKSEIDANEAKLDTIDGVVDGIASALADGTTGLAALKAEIDANEAKLDTIDGVVDSILADTALIGGAADTSTDATVFGKIAKLSGDLATAVTNLTAEVDANEAKLDTIDGVVDGIASEIGDVSAVFGGATPPATVAAALKAIFDAQADAADVWDDALDGTDPAGSAGKRLYDLSQDWANGGRLDVILDELTTQGDTNEGKLDAVLADTGTVLSRLGSPVGANFSADIAAIKAVVDTLQVSVNARLVPSVPSEVYSASAAIRVKLSLNVHDGETGALEDPDVVGTNGAAQGQALIAVKTVGGGSDPVLYDAASAGNVLGTSNAAGLSGYSLMARKGTGRFEAFAEITAYFNKAVEVQFLCYDSDPVAPQQTFTSSRYMVVRSPVQASFGGGAF
jgi:hypothetical protein